MLNKHLETRKIDVVIASNSKIDKKIAQKYYTEEYKTPVKVDEKRLKEIFCKQLD